MVDYNRFSDFREFHWKGTADFSGRLLKNFSYNGNYHQQYYFPQLIHTKLAEKLRRQSLDNSAGNTAEPDQSDSTCQRDIECYLEPGSPTCTARNNPEFRGTSWARTNGNNSAAAANTNTRTAAFARRSSSKLRSLWLQEAMAEDMQGPNSHGVMTGARNFPPQLEQASVTSGSQLPENAESCAVRSCESVTSEDSVFFDDCSVTSDLCSDDIDRGNKPPRGEAGSDDADSSFSSPCSSTSTLEGADGGIQDGGVGGDVKDAGIKVTAQPQQHTREHYHHGRHRPDIHLVIPRPQVEERSGDVGIDVVVGSLKVGETQAARAMGDTEPGGLVDMGQAGDSGGQGASGAGAIPAMSSSYEDREFDFLKAEPVRRSTSLKTYKTPPGTPHRKKGVRFADALGLDLESVRHILNVEEPPVVPKSAMEHLRVGLEKEHPTAGVKYLSALFSQPGADPAFIKRVVAGKVVLENCVVDDKDMTISGLVRVANIAFHKSVLMRYTTNAWLTSDDIEANYVHNSNDGSTDRFSFTLTVPKYFAVGQRLEFAAMYTSGGQMYWDNNCGKNYVIECYARAVPTCESDNTWMHFL